MNILIIILQLGIGSGLGGAIGTAIGGPAGAIVGAGVGTAISAGLGLMTNSINNQNQLTQNQQLLNQQMQYNKDLTTFNENTQLDLWNKTNYAAQVDQLNKAGLNVGLMYKSGGSQGSTNIAASNTSQPSVQSSPSTAIEHQQEINMEQQKTVATVANTEADTLNKIADTNNKQVQNGLLVASKDIATAQAKVQTATVEDTIASIKANMNTLQSMMHIAATNQWIAENNAKTVVETARAQYLGIGLENILIQSKTNLTNEQIKATVAGIQQAWKQIDINKENATTNWVNALTGRQNATTNQTNAETNQNTLSWQKTINDMPETSKQQLNALIKLLTTAAIAL
nr:MAG: DNA pilot protein [Microviridae sp.]